MNRVIIVVLALLSGLGVLLLQAAPADSTKAAGKQDPTEAAVRVLLRAYRAKSFGSQAPAGWPEKIARVSGKWTWVVDIDTTKLPGGFPEQFVVSVSATGGHTGIKTIDPDKQTQPDPFSLYDGFKADQTALRETVPVKVTNAKTDTVNASSREACQAASRVFGRISFLHKNRADILKLLGDPASISDYNERAERNSAEPLVYVFDSGFGGWRYTLKFEKNGTCSGVEAESLN